MITFKGDNMDKLELRIIKSIQRLANDNKEVDTKLVYQNVFEESNSYNETEFLMILEQLKNKNRILVNDNKISIRESDLLVVYHEYQDLNDLKSEGLNFNELEADIGHGCGMPTMGLEFIKFTFGTATALLLLGTTISEIRDSIEQLKWVKNIFKEKFGINQRIIYYGDDILNIIATNKIIEGYKSINITSLKLIDKLKVNLSAGLGLYSRDHYGFSEESLEGRPDTLNYLVFQLESDDLNNLFDIIRIEIRSTGEIMSYNVIKSDI